MHHLSLVVSHTQSTVSLVVSVSHVHCLMYIVSCTGHSESRNGKWEIKNGKRGNGETGIVPNVTSKKEAAVLPRMKFVFESTEICSHFHSCQVHHPSILPANYIVGHVWTSHFTNLSSHMHADSHT